MSAAQFPNNERRILHYDDDLLEASFMRSTSDPEELKASLEQGIDELADAGVDTVSTVTFQSFFYLPGGSTVLPEQGPWTPGYANLAKGGYDPTDVYIDRCHYNGMEYIAAFRMNDRHMGAKGRFISDHPEWQLKGVGEGLGVDYSYEPVRQKILEFIEELLADHNVDGIEFDWVRWCHMFEPGTGPQNAHLLTDFTRKTRELLDAAAQRRGRSRLLLGVRVPQTLEECDYLGFDLASWIKEGLVDYVVPSDFMYTDFNIKVEEFVKLTEGTDCKVYPAVHPGLCRDDRGRRATLADYRAAAQNFYAYGAAGLQTYNYSLAELGYLPQLRDPQTISQGDRHYRFYPLWPNGTPVHGVKDDRIVLDRAQPVAQGSQQFRVAEDLSNPRLRATLQFKAVGLAENEALEIQLNGIRVPDKDIRRIFDADGRNEEQGRVLAPFYLYDIDIPGGMSEPLIINGDNELTVRLIPAEGQIEGTVTIDELEVYVHVQQP